MVRDATGRFTQRPHYEPGELDRECEVIVSSFLERRHRRAVPPITTDELSILIEQNDAALDSYADLSALGENVEGVTEFRAEGEIEVSIAHHLAIDPRRENRLRT